MTIVRWEPLRELSSLQADMNRLFNTAFAGPSSSAGRWTPAMDLLEVADHYVLRADIPGLTEQDLALKVQDNVLTISGARRNDQDENVAGYHHAERAHGPFSRAVTLPKGVDAERVSASVANGVLEVRIPKPEQAQPRTIDIAFGEQPSQIAA